MNPAEAESVVAQSATARSANFPDGDLASASILAYTFFAVNAARTGNCGQLRTLVG